MHMLPTLDEAIRESLKSAETSLNEEALKVRRLVELFRGFE